MNATKKRKPVSPKKRAVCFNVLEDGCIWMKAGVINYRIGANRPCRHALTGRMAAPKTCPYSYECYHWAFDQMLDEVDLAADLGTPACREVAGC